MKQSRQPDLKLSVIELLLAYNNTVANEVSPTDCTQQPRTRLVAVAIRPVNNEMSCKCTAMDIRGREANKNAVLSTNDKKCLWQDQHMSRSYNIEITTALRWCALLLKEVCSHGKGMGYEHICL